MSTLNKAIEYIQASDVTFLLTSDDLGIPYIRPLGAYGNKETELYFLTDINTDKVKQILQNPIVTFYFQNGQKYDTYKSVSVTGEASIISEPSELVQAIKQISDRYPAIKDRFSSDAASSAAVYKVKAQFIKYEDNALLLNETLKIS